jgi:hypothetical protein
MKYATSFSSQPDHKTRAINQTNELISAKTNRLKKENNKDKEL